MRPVTAGMEAVTAWVLLLMPMMILAACIPSGSAAPDREGHCLVISGFPEGKELARCPLGKEGSFSLSFIHSVSQTRVTDVYIIRDNQIVQVKEHFSAHGAGLPSTVDEPGGISWETSSDQFTLHMDRTIVKLVVRTDRNYDNRLVIGSETIHLNQWEDQALHVSVAP